MFPAWLIYFSLTFLAAVGGERLGTRQGQLPGFWVYWGLLAESRHCVPGLAVLPASEQVATVGLTVCEGQPEGVENGLGRTVALSFPMGPLG